MAVEQFYQGKLKSYSDGICSVLIYKNPRIKTNILQSGSFAPTSLYHDELSEEELQKNLKDSRERHMYEVRGKLRDYARNNEFNHFWTLTFDPKKHGHADELRFDLMADWLKKERHKAQRRGQEFRYIFVPEYHTGSGDNGHTVHWHGVTGGYVPELIDSGKKYRNVSVWNCVSWKYGFSNVTKVRSKKKVANYITKYITKDFVNSPVRKGKKKYWASKNLQLPAQKFIPEGFSIEAEPNWENEICSIYEIPTADLEKYGLNLEGEVKDIPEDIPEKIEGNREVLTEIIVEKSKKIPMVNLDSDEKIEVWLNDEDWEE